ncbi:hypothetical protein [uncultured Hoeflea sp.]|uniref:hypothetical protein n=1 Tax=uncultured Hoeflea sp. TaxID=538666 RepID=UPI0030D94474|tara:strand:- start:817 stop:1674 length:858 start_codon:yes stop_codon:yes gene_type:complete
MSNGQGSSEKRFLVITVILIVVVCALLVWVLTILDLDAKYDYAEAVLVNIGTSAIGFLAALLLLKEYNERSQREAIRDELKSDFVEMSSALSEIQNRQAINYQNTKLALDKVMSVNGGASVLGAMDYEELFDGASRVGLLVHSWERWIEDRRRLLETLNETGGELTLVLHNPDNTELSTVSSARWKTRRMDQAVLGENTIRLAESVMDEDKLKVIRFDSIIWYCLMKFEYEDGREAKYVFSPFSHFDCPTAEMPAVVISSEQSALASNFFDKEWQQFLEWGAAKE